MKPRHNLCIPFVCCMEPQKTTWQIGQTYESKTIEYFKNVRPDFFLIAKNYRTKRGEIDLIYEERKPLGRCRLFFIEVRFRKSQAIVSSAESINQYKLLRIQHAALHFLSTYRGGAQDLKVECVLWDGEQVQIVDAP